METAEGVAIVTGAARGIGLATACALSPSHRAVVLLDQDADSLGPACKTVDATGTSAIGVVCDVSDFDDVGRQVHQIESDIGPIESVINNAGITRDSIFHRMSREDWDSVLDVNLGGAFNVSRQAVPAMRQRGHGRIVNVASRAILGNVGQANYSASKAGLVGLTRTLALECARYGITVNCVCPGFTMTPMSAAVPEDVRARVVASIPLGRPAAPEDIANAIAFFCGPSASYITGSVLHVGGGRELSASPW